MPPMSARVTSTTVPAKAGAAHEAGGGARRTFSTPVAARVAVDARPSTKAADPMTRTCRSRSGVMRSPVFTEQCHPATKLVLLDLATREALGQQVFGASGVRPRRARTTAAYQVADRQHQRGDQHGPERHHRHAHQDPAAPT